MKTFNEFAPNFITENDFGDASTLEPKKKLSFITSYAFGDFIDAICCKNDINRSVLIRSSIMHFITTNGLDV